MFGLGDKMLTLLPVTSSPFHAKFAGPYTVIRKVSDMNYMIATPDRRKSSQLCHVNLLKPYHERSDTPPRGTVAQSVALSDRLTSSVSPVGPLVAAQEQEEIRAPGDGVLCACLNNSETLKQLPQLLQHLSEGKRAELIHLIKEFPMLFSDTPTQTHLLQHDIDVGDDSPVRQRFYRVSHEKRKHIDTEVDWLNPLRQFVYKNKMSIKMSIKIKCSSLKNGSPEWNHLQVSKEVRSRYTMFPHNVLKRHKSVLMKKVPNTP